MFYFWLCVTQQELLPIKSQYVEQVTKLDQSEKALKQDTTSNLIGKQWFLQRYEFEYLCHPIICISRTVAFTALKHFRSRFPYLNLLAEVAKMN